MTGGRRPFLGRLGSFGTGTGVHIGAPFSRLPPGGLPRAAAMRMAGTALFGDTTIVLPRRGAGKPFLRARRPYSAGQAGSSASGPSGTGTAGSNSHEASRRTGTPRAVSAARNGSGPSSGKVSRSVR